MGRYIAFCDSDDLWEPEKLEKQLKFLDKNNLSFTCSSYNKIDENGNFLRSFICDKYLYFEKLLYYNQIGCLTVIYDTSKLGKLKMPNMRARQDYALWLLILKEIKKTKTMIDILASHRVRKGSVSSAKFKLIKYNFSIYKNILDYNVFLSFFMLSKFLCKYLKEKFLNFN